ncbi:MAG: LPS O-antigen chain length determinant protein WzzB [Aeromonas sp.]|uniref:LPS O-antigen chain length determinant protein WzzB n=1 Tax=Aeromonas sp. TaxID=647 RepID=UPI003F3E1BAC
MTNKDITHSPNSHLPKDWRSTSDEVDLREVILVLWQKKGMILTISLIFAALGVTYALLARQVWTSQALVSEPTVTQVANLQLSLDQFRAASGIEGVDFSTLQRPALYQGFISAFNSMNNKRTFLIQEGIFVDEVKRENISDHRDERGLMNNLADGISARALDKASTDMTLIFSAETAEEAQDRLVKYIAFIQKGQIEQKNAELKSIWKNRINTLTTQYANIKADTIQDRLDMIRRTQYSLRISEAAGVERPLENLSTKDIFNIDLGSKALAEKLKILEEMKNPELLNPALSKIRLQLGSLKALDLKDASFESFYTIDSPEEPVSRDKPKRPLIVVLATLLGGMLGVGIVLVRHAFRRPEQV